MFERYSGFSSANIVNCDSIAKERSFPAVSTSPTLNKTHQHGRTNNMFSLVLMRDQTSVSERKDDAGDC
jgi:hypothetical protein